jgi:hypothetical protein
MPSRKVEGSFAISMIRVKLAVGLALEDANLCECLLSTALMAFRDD